MALKKGQLARQKREFNRAVAEMRKMLAEPAPIPSLEGRVSSSLGDAGMWRATRVPSRTSKWEG